MYKNIPIRRIDIGDYMNNYYVYIYWRLEWVSKLDNLKEELAYGIECWLRHALVF